MFGDPRPSKTAADDLTKKALVLTGLPEIVLGMGKELDLSQSLPDGAYCGFCKSEPEASDKASADDKAWASAAALLAAEPGLTGIPIFFVLGFNKVPEEKGVKPSKLVSSIFGPDSDARGFSLVERGRYRFRVLQLCEAQGDRYPAFRVNCDFRSNFLELDGTSNLVVGRYDVLEYSFVAKTPGYTEVAVSSESVKGVQDSEKRAGEDPTPTNVTTAAWPAVFSARVPVLVNRHKGLFAAKIAASAAGVLLALVLIIMPDPPWPNDYRATVRWLATVLLIAAGGKFAERVVKFRGELAKELPEP